jgi:hypothetical protein
MAGHDDLAPFTALVARAPALWAGVRNADGERWTP